MTRKGVWNLQQVRDKYLQSLWINESEVWTAGENDYGQLGKLTTSPASQSSPTQIYGDNENWTDIRINGDFVSALKSDASLWVWGRGTKGQLMHTGQNGPDGNRSSPIQVGSYTNVADFSLTTEAIMWINTSGELWGGGSMTGGKLGQNQSYGDPPGNSLGKSSPVQVPGTTWRGIGGGGDWFIATKTDNTLWAWGEQPYGNLGQNQGPGAANSGAYSSPAQIPGTTWKDVAGGGYVALATKTDGTLWPWGLNNQGQLGQNNTTWRSSPVQIPGDWTNCVLKKSSDTCDNATVVKSDGTLWVWGNNTQGQLGLGDKASRSSPIQIPGTYITTKRPSLGQNGGSVANAAIKTDGTAVAWGINRYGQFGNNSTTPTSDGVEPTQLGSTSNLQWIDVAIGGSNLAGIRKTLTSSQE